MSNFLRRQFVATTAEAGAANAANATSIAGEPPFILLHHVFFWLKDPGNPANHQQLKEALRTLAAIPQVKQLMIGSPAYTESRDVVDNSYHVSELIYFHALEDEVAYQVHPIHQAFVENNKHLWEKVVVYDMVVEK